MTKREFENIIVRCFVKAGTSEKKARYLVFEEFNDALSIVCDMVIRALWMNGVSEDADTQTLRKFVGILNKTGIFSFTEE